MNSRNKWIAFSAALVLLAALITATVLAVPSAPTPTATPVPAETSTSAETSVFPSNYTRWNYTQSDYDYVIARMTDGYEKLSVAEFNRLLLDWKDEDAYHHGEDSISRLLRSYPSDKPNADFIDTTIRASYEEISTHHYGGNCTHIAPTYWNSVGCTASEDVFGDKITVFSADASYDVIYRILDEEKITVGERDKIFQAYQEALQTYLDGKTKQELKDRDAMIAGLSKALALLDKSLSTEHITLSSELDDYYVDDYKDWS